MFVSVSVYMHMNTVFREAMNGIRYLRAGVTGTCELPGLVFELDLGSSAKAMYAFKPMSLVSSHRAIPSYYIFS